MHFREGQAYRSAYGKKGMREMTEQETLQELYDELMDRVFVRSDNYLMTIPKRGMEKEWNHYREMAEAVERLIRRCGG